MTAPLGPPAGAPGVPEGTRAGGPRRRAAARKGALPPSPAYHAALLLCRWWPAARRRPAGLDPGEPVLDCGSPECAARSAAYQAEHANGYGRLARSARGPTTASDGTGAIEEFGRVVDSVFGVYLDCRLGFNHARELIERTQAQAASHFGLTLEQLDQRLLTYGDGPPSADGSNELHSVTQGELKHRLAREGPTEKLIANLCIVAVYQYWESNYRAKISAGLRLDAPLESAIFGDLRRVRHWILHQRAIAGDDAGRLELLTWWKPGDRIALDLRMLATAFGHIRDELQVLHQRAQEIPGGKSP